jgi:hypothetical protein
VGGIQPRGAKPIVAALFKEKVEAELTICGFQFSRFMTTT